MWTWVRICVKVYSSYVMDGGRLPEFLIYFNGYLCSQGAIDHVMQNMVCQISFLGKCPTNNVGNIRSPT